MYAGATVNRLSVLDVDKYDAAICVDSCDYLQQSTISASKQAFFFLRHTIFDVLCTGTSNKHVLANTLVIRKATTVLLIFAVF